MYSVVCETESVIPTNSTCCYLDKKSCKFLPDYDCPGMDSCDSLEKQNRGGRCCLSEPDKKDTKYSSYYGVKQCDVVCETCYSLKVNVTYGIVDFISTVNIDCGTDRECLENSVKKYTGNHMRLFDCYYSKENPYYVTLTNEGIGKDSTYIPTIISFIIVFTMLIAIISITVCKIRDRMNKEKPREVYEPIN